MSRFLTGAGEKVAELAERAAEPGRLSRGRALFRKGSVTDLAITEGSVTASVRGSKGDDYETTISTVPAPPGVRRQIAQEAQGDRSVDDLIDDGIDVCPREIDLGFACDCADWDEPCKHVVAVFLAFADRVDLDESALLHWRGIDAPGLPGTTSGARSGNEDSHGPSRSATARRVPTASPSTAPRRTSSTGDRTARLSELESLLGDTVVRVPSDDDGAGAGRGPSTLEPALAEFLGVGMELDPVDSAGLAAPAPLFTGVELGPLADLGPELARALATISARLADTSP